ncbi:MAG TPA: hypothetical protein VGN47_13100 [Blastococcus sp.]|jgi:hypothetical protein|nr:hypothetical protein [Blastococcus sp.]
MSTSMWTAAPAAFLRLGGCDVRPVAGAAHAGPARGSGVVRTVAPVALVQGTGVPISGSTVLGDQKFTPLAHTYGTTLGIPSSRRPSS